MLDYHETEIIVFVKKVCPESHSDKPDKRQNPFDKEIYALPVFTQEC